jgi:CHASE2 domain-containing sensor protein
MTLKIDHPKSTTREMPPLTPRSWLTISVLTILLAATLSAIERQGLLHRLDLQTFDLLVAAQHLTPPSNSVLNVDFDDAFVRNNNAFPIPRLLLAEVMRKIAIGKPAAIGVDVILDLPRSAADDAKLVRHHRGRRQCNLGE